MQREIGEEKRDTAEMGTKMRMKKNIEKRTNEKVVLEL